MTSFFKWWSVTDQKADREGRAIDTGQFLTLSA